MNEAKKLKYDGVVYTDSKKPILGNNWSDIAPLNSQSKERVEGAYRILIFSPHSLCLYQKSTTF